MTSGEMPLPGGARWHPGDKRYLSLADASLAPVTGPGRRSLLLAGLLAVPVALGMVAFVYQLRNGLSVTGLNDQVFWGIYEADIVTFIGFSYGGALVSAILRLTNASWRGPISRIAEGTALVTLLIGSLFPLIHLGRPERVWEMLTRPQLGSPLLWDMVAILTYLLATMILFYLPLIPDLGRLREEQSIGGWRRRIYRWASVGWRDSEGQRRLQRRSLTLVAILIVPLAIMVHTVLSYAFSLTGRPGWHSAIFGPYFVIAAVYSGVAVVILATVAYRRAYKLYGWIDDRPIRFLGLIMASLGVAYAYFVFTDITTEGYVGGGSAEPLLYDLILDRYAFLFWSFVALGLFVPVALVAFAAIRGSHTVGATTVAAVLVPVAMLLKRFLIVVPPLARPLVGSEEISYVPSPVETLITVGAVAAIPLLLILLFRVVPILSVDEIEEIEASRTSFPSAAEGVDAT